MHWEAMVMALLEVKMGTKKVPQLIYLFSRYLLSKKKSQLMLFLTLERSYVSLRVFLSQVKFMKKGISEETLADLCYCDTSSIYLVTSGRKDPYCAEKTPVTIVCQDFKGRWEVSWHCSGVTRWPWWVLPVADPCSCRNFISTAGRSPSVQCTSQAWDLGWDRFACACLHVLHVIQVIVVTVDHKL